MHRAGAAALAEPPDLDEQGLSAFYWDAAWMSEHPEFVRWIYQGALLKRLSHNWHVASRTRLLRWVDDAHRG